MWPGQVCTIPQLYVCSFSAFPARQAVGKSAVCNRDGMDDTQRPQNSPSRLWPNRRHFVWLPAINLKPASCSPPSRRMSCSFFRCSWSGGYRKWNNFWNIKVLRVYSTPAESNDLVSAVVGGGAPQFHSSTAAGCLKIKAQSRRKCISRRNGNVFTDRVSLPPLVNTFTLRQLQLAMPPCGSWRLASFESFVSIASLARGHGHGAGCALNLWHRTFIGQISVHLHACIKTNGRELPEVLHWQRQ